MHNGQSGRDQVGDAIAVLQALRAGPLSIADIAERAGVNYRSAYRLIEKLKAAGCPIGDGKADDRDGVGKRALLLHVTVAGLREWLG